MKDREPWKDYWYFSVLFSGILTNTICLIMNIYLNGLNTSIFGWFFLVVNYNCLYFLWKLRDFNR